MWQLGSTGGGEKAGTGDGWGRKELWGGKWWLGLCTEAFSGGDNVKKLPCSIRNDYTDAKVSPRHHDNRGRCWKSPSIDEIAQRLVLWPGCCWLWEWQSPCRWPMALSSWLAPTSAVQGRAGFDIPKVRRCKSRQFVIVIAWEAVAQSAMLSTTLRLTGQSLRAKVKTSDVWRQIWWERESGLGVWGLKHAAFVFSHVVLTYQTHWINDANIYSIISYE